VDFNILSVHFDSGTTSRDYDHRRQAAQRIGRHCQVVEADTVIRHTGVSIWTSLPLMPPAPCL
jgi:hypothetical protein